MKFTVVQYVWTKLNGNLSLTSRVADVNSVWGVYSKKRLWFPCVYEEKRLKKLQQQAKARYKLLQQKKASKRKEEELIFEKEIDEFDDRLDGKYWRK
jgi:hypothetical protein